MSKISLAIVAACALAQVAVAQSTAPPWGQCGNEPSWTGPTTCPPGYWCYWCNTWYSQCLPGTAPTTAATAAAATTTSES